jgi:hypothetical protein
LRGRVRRDGGRHGDGRGASARTAAMGCSSS